MTYALHKVVSPHRAELYLLAVLTPLLVIFGEIVPKTIGQQSADRWARRLVYPLWLASKLFAPVVAPLTRLRRLDHAQARHRRAQAGDARGAGGAAQDAGRRGAARSPKASGA